MWWIRWRILAYMVAHKVADISLYVHKVADINLYGSA